MQGAQSSSQSSHDSQATSTFSSALATSRSLFTPKRVGFTLAGAFVFVGAAAAMQAGSFDNPKASHSHNFTVQTSTDNTADPEDTSNRAADSADSSDASTSSGSASNSSNTNIHVTVNGQSIDVPSNGSVHQTVPGEDGSSDSSVSVDSSHTHSSTSLHVNVNSSSTSSSNDSTSHVRSRTVVTQNGGTTVTRENH